VMPYKDRLQRWCGYMDVEEEEDSGNFVCRYFILDPVKQYLMYYADNPLNLPDGAKPMVSIKVNYISLISDAPQPHRPKHSCTFAITIPSRKYYLHASDWKEMIQWMYEIRNAAKIVVPKSQVKAIASDTDIPLIGGYTTQIISGNVVRTPWEVADVAAFVSLPVLTPGLAATTRATLHDGATRDAVLERLLEARGEQGASWSSSSCKTV
ncbi:PREDICTED: pleckstrin homology domain-containing family A member 1-like, partial [Priapulus caudatus]|uniref:Pleckstrin homology domain-containing family A member 1-like n=1 Tax=Priapulus caudatus TaxID=37621 RepID=A0ABM1EPC1_PRICU